MDTRRASSPTGEMITTSTASYEVLRPVGKGSYASIVHARDVASGRNVALKLAKRSEGLDPTRELSSLRAAGPHPNIITLLDSSPSYTTPTGEVVDVMVLELAVGDLYEFLSQGGALPDPVARVFFRQLLTGLRHIHSHGVYNRDIKPDNLLLDPSWQLRIADFGFAACGGQELLKTSLGSPGFIPPEVLRGEAYDGAAADVWSAGCVLFTMLNASMPFPDLGRSWYYDRIARGEHALFFKAHRRTCTITAEVEALLTRMLAFNPADRPTVDELLGCEWLQGPAASHDAVMATMNSRLPRVLAARRESGFDAAATPATPSVVYVKPNTPVPANAGSGGACGAAVRRQHSHESVGTPVAVEGVH